MQDAIMARSLFFLETHNEKEVAIKNRVMDIKVENPGRRWSPSTVTPNNSRIAGTVILLVRKDTPL
jgi:hypothetical protein